MTPALKNLLRTHYLNLQGYVSAGMESDKSADKVFLNANENPYNLLDIESANRYPEPQPKALLDGYANLYSVSPDNIVATRGADEALVTLSKLFVEPHKDAIIISSPTFGMYGVNANTMPAKIIDVPLIAQNGTFALDTENIIARAKDKDTKLIFLCSPNNPTGNVFDREDILHIIRETEGHAVIIADETYIEFAQADNKAQSLTTVLPDHPNLIILRTLSKSYAMAGMRMGCLIANDTDFIGLVRSKGLDAYPLPHASVTAALKVMSPEVQTIAQANIKTLLAERERLAAAFEASDAIEHIHPSDANFLLIRMPRAKTFIAACAEQNIIIRDFSDKPGTENCIRISPGLPEENDRVIEILKSFT